MVNLGQQHSPRLGKGNMQFCQDQSDKFFFYRKSKLRTLELCKQANAKKKKNMLWNFVL